MVELRTFMATSISIKMKVKIVRLRGVATEVGEGSKLVKFEQNQQKYF